MSDTVPGQPSRPLISFLLPLTRVRNSGFPLEELFGLAVHTNTGCKKMNFVKQPCAKDSCSLHANGHVQDQLRHNNRVSVPDCPRLIPNRVRHPTNKNADDDQWRYIQNYG